MMETDYIEIREITGKDARSFYDCMKAIDQETKYTRLELTVETPNEAAINLYKKCGFVIEGTKKCTMLVNGNYMDEYMMAKLQLNRPLSHAK